MNYKYKLVAAGVAAVVLAGCSDGADRRRQANQDFNYLNTKPLEAWNLPADAQSSQVSDYAIPAVEVQGELGPAVDIRPPQQVLTLIPGSRTVKHEDGVTLVLLKPEELSKVWTLTQKLIAEQNISLRSQTADVMETDWVSWTNADEDHEIGSRYRIEKSAQGGSNTYQISLIGWREAGVEQPVSLDNKERYSTLMTNLVVARYDQQERDQARLRAQELVKQIPISMGQDRSGLPVIIARAPYNVFWERLPDVLGSLGFTVDGRNRSQGTVEVSFKSPDDEFWTEIGTRPIALDNSSYNIQLGDLGNRTSISITDTDGKPVTEEALESLAPVLAAAIDRANNS
ncbi:outer membrane protein assembly factor BamC [Photobacterium sanctipauli]|uniref:Outer membrane protein assembly factor BamC n=1 Tax=Photobacterium sanctipauli TaxID=1342794 RepID=A0A2T3N8U4_9GAMM|nr:outer membrane protein assembly factor BamC [Photobacterium sanctipauli]PSW09777.1 outer membrane protein assembly factor BamC [Photobacterium sanctipauli]